MNSESKLTTISTRIEHALSGTASLVMAQNFVQCLAFLMVLIVVFLGLERRALAQDDSHSIEPGTYYSPATQSNIEALIAAHETMKNTPCGSTSQLQTQPELWTKDPNSYSETEIASQQYGSVVSDRNSPVDLTMALPSEPTTGSQLFQELMSGTSSSENGYGVDIEVSYVGKPNGIYEVYLNLPNPEAKDNIETYFLGSISFYVNPTDVRVVRTFRMDITDKLIAQLNLGEDVLRQDLLFSIFKVGGSEDETVRIDNVSLYTY